MEGQEESNQQPPNSNAELVVIASQNHGEATLEVEPQPAPDQVMKKKPAKEKACSFPMQSIKIGDWKKERENHNGELTFKCYFKKSIFSCEVLYGKLKMKFEYHWNNIVHIHMKRAPEEDEGGSIEILLNKPPVFFQEADLKPKKHSDWKSTEEDFTDGQASSLGIHDLYFETKIFAKLSERIRVASNADESLRKLIWSHSLDDYFPPEQILLPTERCPNVNGNHIYEPRASLYNLPRVKWDTTDLHRSSYMPSLLPSMLGSEFPSSNPQLQNHPILPDPQSSPQHYNNTTSSPFSDVSIPTQQVLVQGSMNNCFPNIRSNEEHNPLLQTYHQQSLSPLFASSSNPPLQAPSINTDHNYGVNFLAQHAIGQEANLYPAIRSNGGCDPLQQIYHQQSPPFASPSYPPSQAPSLSIVYNSDIPRRGYQTSPKGGTSDVQTAKYEEDLVPEASLNYANEHNYMSTRAEENGANLDDIGVDHNRRMNSGSAGVSQDLKTELNMFMSGYLY